MGELMSLCHHTENVCVGVSVCFHMMITHIISITTIIMKQSHCQYLRVAALVL